MINFKVGTVRRCREIAQSTAIETTRFCWEPRIWKYRARQLCLALAVLAFFTMQICPSAARDRIGNASSLSNKVEGLIGRDARTLRVGSEVYQNELVRTGEASVVRLVFLDNTDLRVGPKSEVTLDRFVYDPSSRTGAVVVKAGLGIFRFITGSQPSKNYLIQTPIASIGVRGTVFDLLVRRDRVTIILVNGAVQVTTLQGRVVELVQPGTSITIFQNGSVQGPSNWRGTIHVDFANAQFPYFGSVQPAVQPVIPVRGHIDHDPHKRNRHVDEGTRRWKKHISVHKPHHPRKKYSGGGKRSSRRHH